MLEAIFMVIGYCIIWSIISVILMIITIDDKEVAVLIGLIWPISVPILLGLAVGCGIIYLVCYLVFDVIGL